MINFFNFCVLFVLCIYLDLKYDKEDLFMVTNKKLQKIYMFYFAQCTLCKVDGVLKND